MNPAIANYLSPWGIVSHRTDTDELIRVRPQLDQYLDHYLTLTKTLAYSEASPEELRGRNEAHLGRFFDDDLDSRAWRGVYKLVGEPTGLQIKSILRDGIHQ